MVGAGTAGCIVAGELAARGYAVELFEAGKPQQIVPRWLKRPASFLKAFRTPWDWNYQTVPQTELAGRRLHWPRGKGVGGCNLLNAMIYCHATERDLSDWAEMIGPLWSPNIVREYQARLDRRLAACLEPVRHLSLATRAMIAAAREFLGPDVLRPNQLLTRRGVRVTTAEPFLGSSTARINSDTSIVRIDFRNGRAGGVTAADGRRFQAKRGVILCAGSLGSPSLLFQSGIGCRDALDRQGIPVIADLPQVGQRLQDHLIVPIIYGIADRFRFPTSSDSRQRQAFALGGRGPLASNLAEACGTLELNSSSAGPGEPIQLLVTPTHYLSHPRPDSPAAMTLGVVGARPRSRGEIRFTSTKQGTLEIDPQYLTDPVDRDTLVEGVSKYREIFSSVEFYRLQPRELVPGGHGLERYLSRYAQTLYHPVGTCGMGLDNSSVVTPTLAVRGVEGIWVADASVFPLLTRVNPQAMVMTIALRAADLICPHS